ncbi:phage antirepressor protein [Candidatus Saccharibacteria bacterium]|nr:phage antirepressor protein [Candidatus Saccharibacteria bacterium]
MNKNLALFEEKEIRRVWQDNKWYFVVEDVVSALTDSSNPKQYIKKLKKRDGLLREGWGQIVPTLRVETAGGKQRMNCADTAGILRIIQSIPSKKAEPFKRWLATVGSERIDEIQNPELAITRMRGIYRNKGYSENWIQQRERGIIVRNRLTDEWSHRGANNSLDYAILTNEIYKGGFGLDAKHYKELKNVSKNQNLRDSMSDLELSLTNLGETVARELHINNGSFGVPELRQDTAKAGDIMGTARKATEKQLGRSIIPENDPKLSQDK